MKTLILDDVESLDEIVSFDDYGKPITRGEAIADPRDMAKEMEEEDAFERSLRRFSSAQAEVITLRDKGFKLREIGQMLNISYYSVKDRLKGAQRNYQNIK